MKNIAIYIGSRANYSSAKPIIKALQKNHSLNPVIILAGSSMIARYGLLESLLEEDGIPINYKVYTLVDGQTPGAMGTSIGLGVTQLSSILQNINGVSYALAVGDRFDVMSFVLAAIALNIPVCHTMGGERSGTIDEGLRHAISKLSNLHFVANEDSRARLIKMGEDPDFVFNTGCPRMDELVTYRSEFQSNIFTSENEIYKKYKGVGPNISFDKFILFSLHPVTTEYGTNRDLTRQCLEAMSHTQLPIIGLWPNADAGSEEISKEIRVFRERNSHPVHIFSNLSYRHYLQLMYMCAVMVGNSSSALREGEMLGTPVVQVGSRQSKRLIGDNVLNVEDINYEDILSAIYTQLEKGKFQSKDLYGNGNASEMIAEILSKISIKTSQKLNFY